MTVLQSPVWPAPAKINRFLHIVGRRDDGYHLLQTIFQFIDLQDFLRFKVRTDGVIRRRTGNESIPEQEDIIFKAALRLQQRAKVTLGVDIDLEKNIPMGAGLGGGSSDAATTLVALNHLWEVGWSLDQLAELGLELGADVPVFVYGRAAWAEGVGERLTPVTLDEGWFLLLLPDASIATRTIFLDSMLTRDSIPVTISDFLVGHCRNDCQAVVESHYPNVREARMWLSQFAPTYLTGTGAALFAPLASQESASQIQAECPPRWRAWVVRGYNHSPLIDRAR